ncbi:copper amine oxidase N-terminal domain-containing protein, partial [Microbacteriaceae bacterium K1510]|nr:copper amine oxidase N-terminal domain-containing protein [Microbacteriaceae bacterium K1510]
GLVTPAVKNVYSIGVYSSEEKGVLFARPVSIGGAPLPAATPTPQPVGTIPTNAAKLKLNVANYTLFGKTYPLSAAPFAANGTTMVPAQFFREG